jgi:predicted esterase
MIIFEIVNEVDNPEKMVIGLHGWSGNEHSLKPVTVGVQSNTIMWHLLRAPYKIQDSKGYSWNLRSHDEQNADERSIRLITSHIDGLINKGINPNDIFILGFSQGAFMALHTAFQCQYNLGGVISIAGFISKSAMRNQDVTKLPSTPYLLLHGKTDDIVPCAASKSIYSFLQNRGIKSELLLYNAGHKLNISAIKSIREFILNPPTTTDA